MRRALRRLDLPHVLSEAADGVEALEFLRATERLPELILLDLNMPRMSGQELLHELREDPRLKDLAVIILSASDHMADILPAYDAGVSAYIVKPIDWTSAQNIAGIIAEFCEKAGMLKDRWLFVT